VVVKESVSGSNRIPVVIDTNILLDIFVFQDPTIAPLREALFSGELRAYRCQRTVDEFADVLSREKFGLSIAAQQAIIEKWQDIAVALDENRIPSCRWKCKDRDDQVFLDMAFHLRPAILLSKDLQVLKFRKRAAKESVIITKDFLDARESLDMLGPLPAVTEHPQGDPSGAHL
jgi:putative PIN family toxin of toxin-antitoxin system